MDEPVDDRADRADLALVDHMDGGLPCQAAGCVELYMCEAGRIMYQRWDVAEYRAGQSRSVEADVA